MCQRESASLQRGMNFNLGRGYSVILMSVRRNAPYKDRFGDDGSTIVYEGHDVPKGLDVPNPKAIDQVAIMPSGVKTQNGLFYEAATLFKDGKRAAALVKVYEKIHQGIWSYNGMFRLTDAWIEKTELRSVFKFKLVAAESTEDVDAATPESETEHRRIIPTPVKMEVWKRDGGKCVVCGATTELHFDHDLPYSKGGTSLTPANVQLMCARHNLSKGAKII